MIQVADNVAMNIDGANYPRMTEAQRKLVTDNINLAGMFLYRRPRSWAEEFVRRFGHDEWDSLAYLTLCRAALKFDPVKGAFSTLYCLLMWQTAYRALKNDNRRELRQQATHTAPSGDEVLSHEPISTDDAERSDAENIEHLRVALRRLTEREREVIRARFYRDQTLAVCGLEMGVSKERVRQLEYRALAKMRAAY